MDTSVYRRSENNRTPREVHNERLKSGRKAGRRVVDNGK